MLTIKVTPTAIYFKDLSNEIFSSLTEDLMLDLQKSPKGYCIVDEPKNLYKILVKISYTYDIELT